MHMSHIKSAIYGGSFDPFHIGHATIIKEVFLQFDIDMLYIVPTYLNPFKKKYYHSPQQRFDFLSNKYKNNKKIKVIDYELNQKKQVQSIETIRYLIDEYDLYKPYFIIGADNLDGLPQWGEIDEIYNLAEFIIAMRDDIYIPPRYHILDMDCRVSSTEIRHSLGF